MNNTALIPKLSGSPFAVMPPAERLCLSADDLAVLTASETIIERGNKTFVEVGRALLTIRDHENGVLYKQRYGTFENYWRERWEFEHAHVYRLMDAAKIYDELAPTGVVAPSAPLPTTERQIRALKGLPTPALRRKAWGEAIQTATEYPISTATVEKAVRKVVKAEGITLAVPRKSEPKSLPAFYRVTGSDLEKIMEGIARLREELAKIPAGPEAALILDEIERRLPVVSEAHQRVIEESAAVEAHDQK